MLVVELDDRIGIHEVGDRRMRRGDRLQHFRRCRARPLLGSTQVELEERNGSRAVHLEAALAFVIETVLAKLSLLHCRSRVRHQRHPDFRPSILFTNEGC